MRAMSRVLVGGVVLALAVPATPAAAKPAGSTPAPGNADNPVTVTLITGDRVRIDAAGVSVEPARRARPVPITQSKEHGDWYVLPGDAAPLVASGALDRELFNVTGLVKQGLDDAHTDVVPLLAEYPDAAALTRATAPAGTRKGRVLRSVNLTVLDEPKQDAPRFWAGIKGPKATSLNAGSGVKKLWLNAKMRSTLDRSAAQVGAPAAWQAGYTGKGVTLAVLDSGYDATHPDLAGRVNASRNFTPAGTVVDKAGHGTHVASIAAGSGSASNGRYRGVAPEADLAVGKVLTDDGWGFTSWIIAGMEWAATEAKAKVVNMSLGGGPSDGSDPLSQAVNRISRQHGTLFVIAAGNLGADGTVSGPSTADEALSVASVTKTDQLSDFSSRGPRVVDHAIKPDLAAPGSDIVAARAAGTNPSEPVGEHYAVHSGTSMASPHVAGAAAILAQQHPDWNGARIKAALMSTAHQGQGHQPTAVGAGRLDLARATSQQVQASPAASTPT